MTLEEAIRELLTELQFNRIIYFDPAVQAKIRQVRDVLDQRRNTDD